MTPSGLAGWVSGRGREVLLLHGGPGMTDYMATLLPELGGYRVASFQQRGVAPSTLNGPFDVPTLRDDVIDVLDTLGWGAPAVIGHSWGGHLLLHVLAVAPSRVGAALVVDPLGVVGDGGYAAFEAELFRRLPVSTVARLTELEELDEKGPLTTAGSVPRGPPLSTRWWRGQRRYVATPHTTLSLTGNFRSPLSRSTAIVVG